MRQSKMIKKIKIKKDYFLKKNKTPLLLLLLPPRFTSSCLIPAAAAAAAAASYSHLKQTEEREGGTSVSQETRIKTGNQRAGIKRRDCCARSRLFPGGPVESRRWTRAAGALSSNPCDRLNQRLHTDGTTDRSHGLSEPEPGPFTAPSSGNRK